MREAKRNIGVFLAVAAAWVFLFVPNPWLSIGKVQGLEWLPTFVFLSLPAVLAAVAIFATVGSLRRRVLLSLCIPLLTIAAYPLMWILGAMSSEGRYALAITFVFTAPTYFGAVAVAATVASLMGRKATPDAKIGV